MPEIINVIIRSGPDDRDLYATSPQAPGLVYGRETLEDLRAELQDVLSFHFGGPGPFAVVEHHERHYEMAGGELVTRMALDEHVHDRQAVYAALGRAAGHKDQAAGLVAAPANALGEVVYVCAVMPDTIGWIADQLEQRGDAINIAVSVADAMILTAPATYDPDHKGMVTINSKPYSAATTISQVVRDIRFFGPTSRAETPTLFV
ncbi:hypothetical protein [Microbispora sp. NBC_01389]|uniref:hypothetical protein n=1 Tax=Microbispora sp. NBC_01389 TaxID=2903584 RepID=UPI00324A3276